VPLETGDESALESPARARRYRLVVVIEALAKGGLDKMG
jgi:hypothetical protein